jgi:hypothetical protein
MLKINKSNFNDFLLKYNIHVGYHGNYHIYIPSAN